MAVRAARAEDLPALLPLMRGYCDFYGAAPADEGLLEMARALIAAPDGEGMLLVACDEDDRPRGFAAVGWKWSSLRGARIAIMEDLFVESGARGRGHADALIEACAARAAEHGAPALIWHTAPDNHRAQAVYRRAGGRGEPLIEFELEPCTRPAAG